MQQLLAPLLLAFLGCSQPSETFEFGVSPVTPAALGSVTTTVGANGNTNLTIDVHHLSPPDRVVQGSAVYVVWAKQLDANNPPSSLGALKVNDKLDGRLETLTVFRSFDLTITPEATATVAAPTGKVVLETRISPRS